MINDQSPNSGASKLAPAETSSILPIVIGVVAALCLCILCIACIVCLSKKKDDKPQDDVEMAVEESDFFRDSTMEFDSGEFEAGLANGAPSTAKNDVIYERMPATTSLVEEPIEDLSIRVDFLDSEASDSSSSSSSS